MSRRMDPSGAHAWFGLNDPTPPPNEPQASTEAWSFFSQLHPGT